MDCFDTNVLIYAAVRGPPGRPLVAALFQTSGSGESAGVGSVLLLSEVSAGRFAMAPGEVRAWLD